MHLYSFIFVFSYIRIIFAWWAISSPVYFIFHVVKKRVNRAENKVRLFFHVLQPVELFVLKDAKIFCISLCLSF